MSQNLFKFAHTFRCKDFNQKHSTYVFSGIKPLILQKIILQNPSNELTKSLNYSDSPMRPMLLNLKSSRSMVPESQQAELFTMEMSNKDVSYEVNFCLCENGILVYKDNKVLSMD